MYISTWPYITGAFTSVIQISCNVRECNIGFFTKFSENPRINSLPTGQPSGWVYFSPDAHSERAWQLWWIGVAPGLQGQGIGGKLLAAVEGRVAAAGGRLLLIETSSLGSFEKTRGFYANRGYAECGCIPDFYAEGDGKVIFAKRVAAETTEDKGEGI